MAICIHGPADPRFCESCYDERQTLILKLERRIHNQRVALRENWEIVEMRANYKRMPKEVRSRMLAGWCRASNEARALREEVARIKQELEYLKHCSA